MYWSAEGKTIFLKCLVLLNHPLEIVGQESVTSIDLYDEFYVNLLFDRFIHRPMFTHMGNSYKEERSTENITITINFNDSHMKLILCSRPTRFRERCKVDYKYTWVQRSPWN